MQKLKWQRVADSDGTLIFYTAVAGQPEPRQPYLSYRISPVGSLHSVNRVIGYSITLWQGNQLLFAQSEEIGSVPFTRGRGEYKLADAKRAAENHYNKIAN